MLCKNLIMNMLSKVIMVTVGMMWTITKKNAQGFEDAKRSLKTYRENEPQAQHKLITRRTLNK